MSVPEEPSTTQDILDSSIIDELRRHGLLRTLLMSQVTEELVETEPLKPEELKAVMKGYCNRYNLSTKDLLEAHCKRHGFSKEDLHWHASLQEWIRRTSQKRFEAKAELHYLTRKEQFDQVTYSQLTASNQFLAQELFLRLNEGESNYGELASQLRQSGQTKGQGRFGPIEMSKVPTPLARQLRSKSLGTLLEPVQVQSKWLVVRLEQFQPSQFDAAMNQKMCAELFQLEVEQLVDERLIALTSASTSSSSRHLS